MTEQSVMLITGSRTGLGHMLVKHYTSHGYQVIGCSRGPFEAELSNYDHFQLDVVNEQSVKKLLSYIRKTYKHLDVLVNNAGTTSANHILLTPLSSARHVLETNVLGTFLCCREAVKVMMPHSYGRIINLSSIHVPLATIGTAIYGASKSAVEQFSRVMAKEVAPFGITVNCLGLSLVRSTGMVENLDEEVVSTLLNSLASKTMLELDDVIHCIDALISQKGTTITGETIFLGGV